jgi:hypothetical protein
MNPALSLIPLSRHPLRYKMTSKSPSSSPVSIRGAAAEHSSPCVEVPGGTEIGGAGMQRKIEYETLHSCGALFETMDILAACIPFRHSTSRSDLGSNVLPESIPIMPQFLAASPLTHGGSPTSATTPSFQRRGRFIVWPAQSASEHYEISATQ